MLTIFPSFQIFGSTTLWYYNIVVFLTLLEHKFLGYVHTYSPNKVGLFGTFFTHFILQLNYFRIYEEIEP
jgi:hypothetical protein